MHSIKFPQIWRTSWFSAPDWRRRLPGDNATARTGTGTGTGAGTGAAASTGGITGWGVYPHPCATCCTCSCIPWSTREFRQSCCLAGATPAQPPTLRGCKLSMIHLFIQGWRYCGPRELQVAPGRPLGTVAACCCSTQSLIHSWFLYGPRLEHVAPTIMGDPAWID
jgi:hypothetical protein